jgi:hypothetical protein
MMFMLLLTKTTKIRIKAVGFNYQYVNVRPFFARSAPSYWWRWDAEEGHGDPSLTCIFLMSTPAGAAILGLWGMHI